MGRISGLFIAGSLALMSGSAACECSPLPGWQAVAKAAEGKFLIFGETHGTEQSPTAFGEYVCAVSGDEPVLVAVELSAFYNEGLQTAWQASPEEFRAALLNNVEELPKRIDGVGSVSMISMLTKLHALKADGADIDIVAFNGPRDAAQFEKFSDLLGQEPHESAQADNIRIAAEKRDYRHVIVLVGGVHAAKHEFSFGGEPWKAMALKLAPDDQVISLVQRDSGGEAWNCRMPDDVDDGLVKAEDLQCAPFETFADDGMDGEARMAFWAENDTVDERYDGYFYLGPTTASPPAFSAKE